MRATGPTFGSTWGSHCVHDHASSASSAHTTTSCRSRGERRVTIEARSERTTERSEEHTSELQSLMRISYAVFCLKKKKQTDQQGKRMSQTTEDDNYKITFTGHHQKT